MHLLQAYESWVIDMHHWKIILRHQKFYKSISGRFAYFSSNDVERLLRTHMLVVIGFQFKWKKI